MPEPAGAALPLQRRVTEALATCNGMAMSVYFISKGMTAASYRSLCISTDGIYGLSSMFLREISGSKVTVSLHTKMASFLPLASSMWHLSSIVTQAAHGE